MEFKTARLFLLMQKDRAVLMPRIFALFQLARLDAVF